MFGQHVAPNEPEATVSSFVLDCCCIMSCDVGCTAFLCEGSFTEWLIQETSMNCTVVFFPRLVIDSLAYLRLRTRILMCKY